MSTWRAVRDLPECPLDNEVPVLVTVYHPNGNSVRTGHYLNNLRLNESTGDPRYYDEEKTFFATGFYCMRENYFEPIDDVAAWMPFPEPYKGVVLL